MHGSCFNPQLSKNFTLDMLCLSKTADLRGIINFPHEREIVQNLKALAENILEPFIDHLNLPITVTSAYRSPELNAIIGGREDSQHVTGEAVDFIVGGLTCDIAGMWIVDNIQYDELILEKFDPGKSEFGWLHCSYSRSNNRKITRTFDGIEYHNGLVGVGVHDAYLSGKIAHRSQLFSKIFQSFGFLHR